MFQHILAVQVAVQRETLPENQVPTADQVAKIHQGMVRDNLADCQSMSTDEVRCVMTAGSTRAMAACAVESR
jgi:hypothetical protein